MGGYSSDSDGDYSRKSKKKKKKRSRSRSRSSSGESSRSRKNKHKKSKKSKHRRARSRSRERRSRSRDRRSRSRGRRSRSRDRRSRSRDRRSRSREKRRGRSRDRRSRSRSRSYSKYRSRTQSRSRSRERSRRSRSRDKHRQSDQQNLKTTEVDPCASVPGFNNMTPAQQSRIRMEMALKAAAAADEKLKEQGLLPQGLGRTTESAAATLTVQDQQQRVKTIEDIESEGFAPTAFKSTRGQESSSKVPAHPMTDVNHEAAMFGFTSLPTPTKGIKYKETDNFMHPNLYVTAEEKMEKWIQKLIEYRKQKLEGEAMS